MNGIARIDEQSVIKAYARWAPVYDFSFGPVADAGRKRAIDIINQRSGTLLEVGVGTGVALPRYAPHLTVTGIDLSPDMLRIARQRVRERKLTNIAGIYEMDASELRFEDASFDTVVAMYVMTVVPDPVQVLRELERVCAPGGEVVIVNHFAQDHGVRGWVESFMAPAARALGWHPDFRVETITDITTLDLVETVKLKPFSLFTMLRFHKPEAAETAVAPEAAAAV
ncbi:class I SAM-dependent methyltransferase [Parvibaculum sp.]|uniref:class I SAM-dependent methyltransferase n=1 Tax=Parvibaculum sp. TaxID=2024848 RepID=UPI002732184C|nr:methyltransferase domain-containing protein [Parvibaculum sp.]MDP1628815.1 methyltransferase domain-containing protein [Parvibaculum sp.]MDP2148210.1 methyltransferase domain-containing protein [Parvibaculum sp.]MDP3330038.1 methyltransferase domain-containing protein [Parvibaculum sp.]